LLYGPDEITTIVQNWVAGTWSTADGAPGIVYLVTDAISVPSDGFTLIEAYAMDRGDLNNMAENYRTGWGIVFTIERSTCAGAVLYGRDPTPALAVKDLFVEDVSVFEYTDTWANLGIAAVELRAYGCSDGDTIAISACIPGDTTGFDNGTHRFRGKDALFGGRGLCAIQTTDPGYPYAPSAASVPAIEVATAWGGTVIKTCETISIQDADPTGITEGANHTFTAWCTYDDASSGDCTADATWGVTGASLVNNGNSVDALQVPCNPGGGGVGGVDDTGTVTADWAECTITNSDVVNVEVLNDDVQTDIACTPDNVDEDSTGAYTCNALWWRRM
jgi:hypothetical protein